MSFAREGYPFIGIAMLLAAGGFAVALGRRSFALWVLAVVLLLVALWVAYFFRDPERTGVRGARLVIAPADGLVLPIIEIDEPSFLNGRAVRISIFMNVFSVHVNRYPVDGTVQYVHYNPGKFITASRDKASLENEQMSVGIAAARSKVLVRQIAGLIARRIVTYSKTGDAARSKVLVRQIAGLIARRIVTYSKTGDVAKQGERFGLIRFGSRVDVFVPVGTVLKVKAGDHTSAGTTLLAELPQ